MLDIVFVILHYNTYIDTMSLIDSIGKNIDTELYHIVIVDNNSPNKSGNLLETKYADSERISTLILESNIGFANGNNAGIEYSRKKFPSKYICCLNNDTILIETKLIKKLNEEYRKSNCSIIGPRAYLQDGYTQYSGLKLKSLNAYKKEYDQFYDYTYFNDLKQSKVKKILNKFPCLYKYTKKFKQNFINPGLIFKKKDVVLHGSCLFFTPAFFEKLSGFDTRTFLYKEEELLYLAAIQNNLTTVYLPQIKIIHKEDSATNSIVATSKEKQEFTRKYELLSLQVLIQEYEKYLELNS